MTRVTKKLSYKVVCVICLAGLHGGCSVRATWTKFSCSHQGTQSNQSKSVKLTRRERNDVSKTKLFLQVVEDVQALADSLQELAVAMKTNEPEPQVETPEPTMETKSEVKQPTLEEVRGLLARKSQEGKSTEVKALIEKYGASRLSDVPTENYAALVADAEGL
ncbi:predicted protein [Listeria monocytogenes FSL N1-017]|nr:predicted protein [Listeria monocytogenes FSL N1-017]DAL82824.1 MAG TPA: hypothetical protein [Caudoviricetes sp.]